MKKTTMLIILALLGTMVFAQEYDIKNVVFPEGRLDISIYHYPGKEEWAGFIAETTPVYIQAVEKFLDTSFKGRYGFDIYGDEKVYLDGRWVGGFNGGSKVALQYDISQIGNPALLYHELGHYWFGSRKGLEWLEEGIVSFMPVVMAETGHLPEDFSFTPAIKNHWGLTNISAAAVPAFPVERDSRNNPDTFGNFYLKTFLVQYLIYQELGPEKYHGFVKDLYHENAKKVEDFSDVIVLLASWKGDTNWRAFLSGWVTAGDYKVLTPDDFGDGDNDGIIGVDEVYLGTDKNRADTDGDGIPDWEELYEVGTDPLVKNPASLLEKHAPFVDGYSREWQAVTAIDFSERKGESGYPADHDFTRMFYTIRGDYLYVNVQTRSKPFVKKDVMFDLLMDYDGDNKADGEAAFMLTNPRYVWYYSYAENDHQLLPGLKGSMNDTFEIRVPLNLIEDEPVGILPIIRDNTKKVNYDEWDTWIPVYPVYADLEDLDNIIEEYDLFIDGEDDNWGRFNPVEVKDRVGDAKGRKNFDLISLDYFFKGGYLYLKIKTGIFTDPLDDIMLDVLMDINGDNKTEMETAFMLGRPQYTWIYDYALGGTLQKHSAKSDMAEVVEMRIPIEELGIKNVSILPIIRNNADRANYDEWDRWIKIK